MYNMERRGREKKKKPFYRKDEKNNNDKLFELYLAGQT